MWVSDSTFVNFCRISAGHGGGVVRFFIIVSLLSIGIPSNVALAHGGGLAADGCHNDRKNGDRHCHGGTQSPPRVQRAVGGNVSFQNCTAARAAGAAPVRAGQPGYGRHLDRDGDGIGCE